MAKVSIIVPVYNTEKYLKKCINSLLEQTFGDIEIIIINDGSPDNSDKLIKSYTDKRIKYLKKDNSGIGSTRNLGIDVSTGKYLMFVDSDDYVTKDCVLEMYNKASNDKCDLVISNYYEDRNGCISEIKYPFFYDTDLSTNPDLLNNVNLGPCNKLYSKCLFSDDNRRFEEKLKYEDAPFVCKMLVNAKKIGKVEKCLSYYVIHDGSETTIRDKKIFDIIQITDIIIADMSKYDYLDQALINLIVMILSDYTIQTRYLSDKKLRNDFIDVAFEKLDSLDSNWRKCDYLKKFNFIKRCVKTNKPLAKLYCGLYSKKRRTGNK